MSSSPLSTTSLQDAAPSPGSPAVEIPLMSSLAAPAGTQALESSAGDLLVTPSALEFADVEPGVEYRLTFSIKNRLARPQRVRVVAPALAHPTPRAVGGGVAPFSVRFSAPLAAIAPGMTAAVDVVFAVPGSLVRKRSPLEASPDAAAAEEAAEAAAAAAAIEAIYRDIIVVRSESGGEIRLPVLARTPAPRVFLGDTDANTLDFGTVASGSIIARDLIVRNASKNCGALIEASLALPHATKALLPMRVRPARTLLAAAGSELSARPNSVALRVLLDARTLKPGSYRALLDIKIGGAVGSAHRVVDVTIQVIDPVVALIVPDSKGAAGSRAVEGVTASSALASHRHGTERKSATTTKEPLHLGTLFPGQRQVVHAQVVNNSPAPVNFTLFTGTHARALLRESSGEPATTRGLASGDATGHARGGPQKHFSDIIVATSLDNDEDESPRDAIAASVADLDFIVTPSVGVVPPFGSVPVQISYTAVDRRKPPSFVGHATNKRRGGAVSGDAIGRTSSRGGSSPVRSSSPTGSLGPHDSFLDPLPPRGMAATVAPSADDGIPSSSELFSSILALVTPELGQRVGVKLLAQLVRPEASVTTNVVDFGNIAYNSARRTATIELISETELLPIAWRAVKCTGFHVTPDSGVLLPQQAVELVITFKPTRVGPVNEVMPISFFSAAEFSSSMVPKVHTDRAEPLLPGAPEHALNAAVAEPTTLFALPIALSANVLVSKSHEATASNTPRSDGVIELAIAPPIVTGADFRRTTDLNLSARPLLDGPLTVALGEGGVAGGNRMSKSIAVAGGGVLHLTQTDAVEVITARRRAEEPGHGAARSEQHSNVISARALEATSRALALGPSEHPQRRNTVDAVVALSASTAALNRVGVASSTALLESVANRGLALADFPGDDARYTFFVSRLHAKAVRAAMYNAYLLESHAARRRARGLMDLSRRGLLAQWDDAVSLGMNEGKLALMPPRLRVPEGKEPLWQVRTVRPDGSVALRVSEARKVLNPDKIFSSKFKTAPTTHSEKIDAARSLTPDELEAVVCGPPIIDVGETILKHEFKKTWGVVNGLTRPVLISLVLPSDARELAKTSPISQLVPPGGHAGFVVTFLKTTPTGESEGHALRFSSQVTYTINGIHASRFTVLAQPTPARVTASLSRVQLSFSEHNFSPYVSETVRITNPNAVSLACRWIPRVIEGARSHGRPRSPKVGASSRPSSAHAVGMVPAEPAVTAEPDAATIGPGATEEFTFVYRPQYRSPHNMNFLLELEGGVSIDHVSAVRVHAHGEYIDARIAPLERVVDFGKFGVGLKRDVTLALRNSGTTPGVFYVQSDSLPPYVSVTPMVARVEAGETIDLSVTLAPNEPYILDPNFAAIHVAVRGGKPLVVPLSAVVVLPDVTVDGDFDFGGVVVGSTARRRITIVNLSDIHTELAVDFAGLAPQWRVKPPKPTGDDDAMSVGDQSILRYNFGDWEMPGGRPGVQTTEAARKVLAGDRDTPVSGRDSPLGDASEVDDDDDDNGEEDEDADFADLLEEEDGLIRSLPARFIVKLIPGATLMFDLVFSPLKSDPDPAAKFDFLLPVSLFTTIAVPLPGLLRRVTGHGLAPRIRVESTFVDFGSRAFLDDPARRVPSLLPLRLFNTCPKGKPVSWHADTSNLSQYFPGAGQTRNFGITPDRGTIAPGRSQTVEISFQPFAPHRTLYNTIPIHLDDVAADAPPYLELEVMGKGIEPQLSFDRREIILPPVPIGVTVRGTFWVINTGFDYLELTMRIPANEITAAVGVPLTVSFPHGQVLSSAVERVPVEIEFHALQAMAFTVTIELGDAATGRKWGMPVTGVADNCMLSSYTYLNTHRGTPLYLECCAGEAPQLVPEDKKNDGGSGAREGGMGTSQDPASPSSWHGSAGRRGKAVLAVADAPKTAEAALPKPPSRDRGARKPQLKTGMSVLSAREAKKETTAELAPRAALRMELPIALASATDLYTATGRAALPGDISSADSPAGRALSAALSSRAGVRPRGTAANALAALTDVAVADAEGLVRWLNASGVLAAPITDWPGDVVRAHGKPIFDFIELVSGRLIPGRLRGLDAARLPTSRRQRSQALFRQAADALSHLKQLGAHVHGVRAETLLPVEEFLMARKYIPRGVLFGNVNFFAPMLDPRGGARAKRAAETRLRAAHNLISLEAWTVLTMQAVKLFGLGRVNLRALVTATPGTILDSDNGALWAALVAAETELAADIRTARTTLVAVRNIAGPTAGSVAVPMLKLPAAVGADERGSVRGSVRTASTRQRAPTYIDPESTEAIVAEKRRPRPKAGFEPSIILDDTPPSSPIVPSSRRSVKSVAQSKAGSSRVDGATGSVAGSRVGSYAVSGGGGGGGAMSVAGSIAQTIIGSVTGGRHETFKRGPIVDPLSLKAVDPILLVRSTAVHEKARGFLQPDSALTQSNVYSAAELLLLRWLAWHYNRMYTSSTLLSAQKRGDTLPAAALGPRRLVCFERDLADGTVFIHVLLSHAPELGKPGRSLDAASGSVHLGPSALSPMQARDNARAIIAAVHELNLEPPFRVEDLFPMALSSARVEADASSQLFSSHSNDADPFAALVAAIKSHTAPAPLTRPTAHDDGYAALPQTPELTTEVLASPTALSVTPFAPLFDDTSGVVAGVVPGSDLLRLRLPTPGDAASSIARDSPHARDMVLYALWFFNSLPSQVPRALVDFKCNLGTPCTKTIVLSNPTKRAIVYEVFLEQDPAGGVRADAPTSSNKSGPVAAESASVRLQHALHSEVEAGEANAPVWALSSTRIVVNAESTARFPVTATPAFSAPSHAKIRFVSTRRSGGLAPSILTFALRTVVMTRTPLSVVTIRAPVYTTTTVDVEVANPTLKDSSFLVSVIPLAADAARGANVPASITRVLLDSNPTTADAAAKSEVAAAAVVARDVRLGLEKPPIVSARTSLAYSSVGPPSDVSASEYMVTGWQPKVVSDALIAAAAARPPPPPRHNVLDPPQLSSARLGTATPLEISSAAIRLPSYLLPGFSFARRSALAARAAAAKAAAEEAAVLAEKRAANGGVDPDEGPDFPEPYKARLPPADEDVFADNVAASPTALTSQQELLVGRSRTAAGKPVPSPGVICRYRTVHLPGRHHGSPVVKRLPLQFSPLSPGVHRFAVVLVDAASCVAEVVFEVDAFAEDPVPTAAPLRARVTLANDINKIIKLPPVNSLFENARDATLLRLPSNARPLEIAHRERDRRIEVEARTAALTLLRKSFRAAHPTKGDRIVGEGSQMWSRASTTASVSGSPRAPAQPVPPSAKIVASLVLGTLYSVHVDSPFFSAPSSVYVPAPLTVLPAVGAGVGSKHDLAEQSFSNSAIIDGGASVLSHAHIATLVEATIEDLPGELGSKPGLSSIAAMPPSQAAIFRGKNAPVFFSPLTAPLAIADALGEGTPDALSGLGALQLTCSPRTAGVYSTRVVLSSDRDTRVYHVELTVDDAGPTKAIQMAAPIGGFVRQTIPVANFPSSGPRAAPPSEWALVPQLRGVGRNAFDLLGNAVPLNFTVSPALLEVPVGGVSKLMLEWRPIVEGDELVQLELVPAPGIMSSAAVMGVPPLLYDLHGIGEPPLALGTLTLRTHARGTAFLTVDVPSPLLPRPGSHATCLRIKCTVPGAVVAADLLVPPPGEGTAPLKLEWSPPTGSKSIVGTLIAEDLRTGRYVWWALSCEIDEEEPVGKLALSTIVRGAVAADIEVVNPSSAAPLELEVTVAGDGLLAPSTLIVPRA